MSRTNRIKSMGVLFIRLSLYSGDNSRIILRYAIHSYTEIIVEYMYIRGKSCIRISFAGKKTMVNVEPIVYC